MKRTIFILYLLSGISFIYGEIRIVLSAALSEKHYDFRKAQYIESFEYLRTFSMHNFYVIEALKKEGPTFLDEYCNNVFYSDVNDPTLKNNGINEAKTLLQGLELFDFDPDDIILKITGRYQLISDEIIKLIQENPSFDAFIKTNSEGSVYTLCFAMKYNLLKKMYKEIDYQTIEKNRIPIEYEIGNYIKKEISVNNLNIYYLKTIGIKANIFGSTTAPNSPNEVRFY